MRTVEELHRMVVVVVMQVVVIGAGSRRRRVTEAARTPLTNGGRNDQWRTARRSLAALFQHLGVQGSIQRAVSVRQTVVMCIYERM